MARALKYGPKRAIIGALPVANGKGTLHLLACSHTVVNMTTKEWGKGWTYCSACRDGAPIIPQALVDYYKNRERDRHGLYELLAYDLYIKTPEAIPALWKAIERARLLRSRIDRHYVVLYRIDDIIYVDRDKAHGWRVVSWREFNTPSYGATRMGCVVFQTRFDDACFRCGISLIVGHTHQPDPLHPPTCCLCATPRVVCPVCESARVLLEEEKRCKVERSAPS